MIILLNITIENQNLKLSFDNGGKGEALVLDNYIIEDIKDIKIKKDKRKSIDLIGRTYEIDHYNLPKMKIEDISFNDIEVSKYKKWGINISSGIENHKNQGVIGLKLFEIYFRYRFKSINDKINKNE